jgi:hypothetical protein
VTTRNTEVTCGPCAYGLCAERVEQVTRTSEERGVLRGNRFAFMACDCVAAVDLSFRNLQADCRLRLLGQFPPLHGWASFQNAITFSS